VERDGVVEVGLAETGIVPLPAGAVPAGAVTVPLEVGYGALAVVRVERTGTTVEGAAEEAAEVAAEESVVEAITVDDIDTEVGVDETVEVDAGMVAVRVTPALKQNVLANARVVAVSAALQAASTSCVTWAIKVGFEQIQAMLPAVQPGTVADARPVTML